MQKGERTSSGLTSAVDDDVGSWVVETPALLNLLRSQPTSFRTQCVEGGEHDHVGLLGWLPVRRRSWWRGRSGDFGVKLGGRDGREVGRVR